MQVYKHNYLEYEPWRNWLLEILKNIERPWSIHRKLYSTYSSLGESPALEVMKYRDKDGYFASKYLCIVFGVYNKIKIIKTYLLRLTKSQTFQAYQC